MMHKERAPVLSKVIQLRIMDILSIRKRFPVSKEKLIVELLNKLVQENAEEMTEELVEIMRGETRDLFEFLADCMFNKAIMEQLFVDVNASVVRTLHKELTVPLSEDGKPASFRALLLRRCQKLFQAGLDEAMKAEDEEAKTKSKKRYLGDILFTVELYKQCLVPTMIVVEACLKQLRNKIFAKHEFSYVEPLYKLLKSAGAQLEKDVVSNPAYKKLLDDTYTRLGRVKNHPSMGKRDFFMIKELLELRPTWVSDASVGVTPSEPAPVVVKTVDAISTEATTKPASPKVVDSAALRNRINSSLDEYLYNCSLEDLYMDFDDMVKSSGSLSMLVPSILNYCIQKNLPQKDTENLTSALSEYSAFKSSEREALAKGVEDVLNVLQDVEDVTESVIKQFSLFMSILLRNLDFSVTPEFVDCLYNLKDCDPFCSLKEKKKYGASALYFVGTLSAVKEANPEQAKAMSSKAKDSPKIFNNEEQRKALYEMYDIALLL